MRTAVLKRRPSTDQGTFGVLTTDRNDQFYTGELPDRQNAPGLSSVPPGTYRCELYPSPKFGVNVYRLQNVPGHGAVEIHWGNWCGDRALGYHSDVDGCIILGTDEGELRPPESNRLQHAVLHSRYVAFPMFMAAMGGAGFLLTIENATL